MAKNTAGVLREANKYLVLQCVTNYHPITIENVIEKTGISRPTVVALINELTKEGFVEKGGFTESTGGRSPALFLPSLKSWFAVGVDFEIPEVRFVVADMAGECITSREVSYDMETNPDQILQDILDNINQILDQSKVDRANVVGIGIGISGVIDVQTGTSRIVERLSGWKDVPIKKFLESHLNYPVYISNDVHLMGFVEKKLYLDSAMKDFVYIGLRSGIGGLIVKNGQMWEGKFGNAGFIGHMTVDPNGPKCHCGKRGCLDVFSGQLALQTAYDSLVSPEKQCRPELKDLILLSGEGDKVATGLLRRAGYYLGIAIANIVKLVEIPTVIIGGCDALEGSCYYSELKKTVKEFSFDVCENISISCGHLTEKQFALGGCFFAFEHMFEKPKLSLSV